MGDTCVDGKTVHNTIINLKKLECELDSCGSGL